MKRCRRILACAVVMTLAQTGLSFAQEADWDEMIAANALQADFDALYAGLKSAHVNLYAHRNKAEYDALHEKMRTGFDEPVSRFDAQIAFQKFTAFGNVAHARIEFPNAAFDAFREAEGRTFPIFLRITDSRAYAGEDYSGHQAVAPGDEILAINGAPIAEWLKRTAAHISADTPYIAHSLLEFTFPQYLWVELGEVASFELELKTSDGVMKSVTVEARTRAEQGEEATKLPAGFTLDANARVFKMLDDKIAYLRPGPFYNVEDPNAIWDNSAFIAFIDASFENLMNAGAQTLVIDLRENPGGDNSFSDHMLAWIADEPFRFCSAFLIKSSDEAAASNQARLDGNAGAVAGVSALFAKKYAEVPRGELFEFEIPFSYPREGARFDGDVYVLVNRHSYSNAVNVAAIVQDYRFGVIAGEKTSDMATTYGAMETFMLPETGMSVGFPKAHIIRPSGEKKSDGVTPDLSILSPVRPTTEDIVLEKLIAAIAKG